MRVHTDGARSIDLELDQVAAAGTYGALGSSLAEATFDATTREGSVFSVKVDGVPMHPGTRVSDITDTSVVELIEVTDHNWGTAAAATPPPPPASVVPDGTVEEIVAWVDDDIDRADAALQAEHQREHPRTTLIEALTQIIG